MRLFEESRLIGGRKPQVRFCEGLGPTGVWLKYCGTAGKPGGKRRKQTSTCSIGRNRSTRLNDFKAIKINVLIDWNIDQSYEARGDYNGKLSRYCERLSSNQGGN